MILTVHDILHYIYMVPVYVSGILSPYTLYTYVYYTYSICILYTLKKESQPLLAVVTKAIPKFDFKSISDYLLPKSNRETAMEASEKLT